MTLHDTIEKACAMLPPRANYARAVLRGEQRWSGADLKGKARRFGAGYARQRNRAAQALRVAGGAIIAIDRGLRVTAVRTGQDDYGNVLWETSHGQARGGPLSRARLI